jgi:hypothetical protein
MKSIAAALLLAAFLGCDRTPTPEEVQKQQDAERAARPVPTPRPGAWMKDAKSPLDKKPAH